MAFKKIIDPNTLLFIINITIVYPEKQIRQSAYTN